MSDTELTKIDNRINNKIHTVRGRQVILDEDLAVLYKVQVKRLNEQVRRNIGRFPVRFMFQLTESEFEALRSQFATLEKGRGAHRKYHPYAFTEQGVAMLSGVLNSEVAVKVSIQIMDAFIAMRRFIASNAQVFYRLDKLETKQIEHVQKIEQIFQAIESKGIKPEMGIFFNGQVFDAYKFVSDLIRSADESIILIDNYVDDSVLTMLCKRKKGVSAKIYTKDISKQLKLDVDKCNAQYPPIEVFKFTQSHDRFLIIDDKEIYHIGASLKDLGKKWFGFSKMSKEAIASIGKALQ